MSANLSKDAHDAAKKVFLSLLITRKNFSLYPESHSISLQTIQQFQRQLDLYLRQYGELMFYVEKDRLIFNGEVVHSEMTSVGALPFTLFRDGIRWIAFYNGITTGELRNFFSIINKYGILSNEPEGDIVTDFWQNKMPHIKYETADFFGDIDHQADITYADKRAKMSAEQINNNLKQLETMMENAIDPSSILLSAEELTAILEMVRLEEGGGQTEYLDALLDSLLNYQVKDNFETILEVLTDEFKNSLVRRDFAITHKIMQSIQYIVDSSMDKMSWAAPLIKNFYYNISSRESLRPLNDIWPDFDQANFEKIEQSFALLDPEAIDTLAMLLLKEQPAQLRQMLIETIILLALQNQRPLEKLLANPDEKLLQNLIPVLANLRKEQSLKILLKLIHHPSASIRKETVKTLLQQDFVSISDIFILIDDKDDSIRHLVLKQIGKAQDNIAEGLLLNYLQNRKFKKDEDEHVIDCLRALGRCGSLAALPFLSKSLLKRRLLPGSGKKAWRRGAAIALHGMKFTEAREILEKACRSIYPGIRVIARKTLQGQK